MWTKKHTFGQVLNDVYDNPLSQLSFPCIKRDLVSIQIDENVYLASLEVCKQQGNLTE